MKQQNLPNENAVAVQEGLMPDVQENLQIVMDEITQRRLLGLIPAEEAIGTGAIESYLNGVSSINPWVDGLTSTIAGELRDLPANVEMIMTIPILGMDNQEWETAQRLIEVLSQQEDVISGKVAVFIYVNWPEGRECDETLSFLKRFTETTSLPLYVFGSAIPQNIGRYEAPLASKSYEEAVAGPQIALIRDILNIIVMKKFLSSGRSSIPIILQSDADLISVSSKALRNIIRRFQIDPTLQLLQCNVDWDGSVPTKSILPLLLGSILMRELPWQILKKPLNSALPKTTKRQIIFSDAVQRGIQVAQAEKLDSVARKGGYGLLMMNEDELDLNLRTTAEISGVGTIGTTDDTLVFSNRRAITSWYAQAIPPISQWKTEFEIDDPVRTRQISIEESLARINERGIKFEIINAIRLTLQRFSLPPSLVGIYQNPSDAILGVLRQIGLRMEDLKYKMVLKEDGTYYLDVQDISDEGIINILTILSEIE